jgi:hypothetical protein
MAILITLVATKSMLYPGFCKICFGLVSRLLAIAFVYAGPDNIDMTIMAVALGILAPVLAFGIASGSGLNALSYPRQSGRLMSVKRAMTQLWVTISERGFPGILMLQSSNETFFIWTVWLLRQDSRTGLPVCRLA